MHGVEVSDQHAPERVNGRNELALEGIDNRMLLLQARATACARWRVATRATVAPIGA